MVGVLCLLGGALRLGFVANFLSKPVIVGFMHGLALVIVGAQLPKVLGIRSEGETTLEQFASVVHRLGDTNLASLAIGGASLPSSCSVAASCCACLARSWLWSARCWPSCCSASTARAWPWWAASRPACRRFHCRCSRSAISRPFCRSRW